MAAASREMFLEKNGARLMGMLSKDINCSKEGIEITTDDDDGFRRFLGAAGTKTLDINFSGITADLVLRGLIMSDDSKLYTDIELHYAPEGQTSGDVISGDFYLGNLSESGGGSDDAVQFTGTLQSSGPWVYTVGT